MAHTFVYCPYCRKQLDMHIGVGKGYLPVGPPAIPCPFCFKLIKTEVSEWAEKTSFQRAAFFLHVVLALVGAIIYWGGGFALVASGVDYFLIKGDYLFTKVAAVVGALAGVIVTIKNVSQAITKSLERKPNA